MLDELLDRAEAVLFDFDGVLVDSERHHFMSYNAAFQKRGHTLREEEYWEHWTSRGEGIAGEVRRHGLGLSPAEMEALYAEAARNFSLLCREDHIPFFPGMLEGLLELEASGMPCAIASNSREDDISMIFERAGHSPPPCIVVGRRAGLRSKPHPDIYVYAAGVLRTAPSACLAVEDAHKGLEAARTVGMPCVILKNELNRGLEYPGADAVIESHSSFLSQLRDWLGR
jgi:beta-phosphoglucomutase-like phosphatase (HAD superfamily)